LKDSYELNENNKRRKSMKKMKKLCIVALIMAAGWAILSYLYKNGKLPYTLPVPPSQQ